MSSLSTINQMINPVPQVLIPVVDLASVTVVTYNLGTFHDFEQKNSWGQDVPYGERYAAWRRAEKCAVGVLNADIFFLQEVGQPDRPFVKALEQRGYRIFHDQIPFNTAIACSPRFSDIQNLSSKIELPGRNDSRYEKDVTILRVFDTANQTILGLASVHVPGLPLDVEVIDQTLGVTGDIYCQAVLDKISSITEAQFIIIGGDFNATPELYGPRFSMFSEMGYRISSPGITHKNLTSDAERALDYVLSKTTMAIRWVPFGLEPNLHFWRDPNLNASDHVAVFTSFVPMRLFNVVTQSQ